MENNTSFVLKDSLTPPVVYELSPARAPKKTAEAVLNLQRGWHVIDSC